MGFDKILASLADKPVLWHSLQAFCNAEAIEEIILVCSPERVSEIQSVCALLSRSIKIVPGGAERVDSVLSGLHALATQDRLVAIHDAARPLILPAAINACFAIASEASACVCAEPLTDTIHRVDAQDQCFEPVPREHLWRMQTPQVFAAQDILSLLESQRAEGKTPTDEVGAMLAVGKRVPVYQNPDWNFKITYPQDLTLAEAILQSRTPRRSESNF